MSDIRVNARYGVITVSEMDSVIGQSILQYGEWAQDEIDFLTQFLQPGDAVIDAGANIGTHTLAFASIVGDRGAVWSFEPQAHIYELLKKNCEESGVEKIVHSINAALSDQAAELICKVADYDIPGNFGAIAISEVGENDKGVSVQTMTLDSLNLKQCQLLKLDVEGYESKVLAGAKNLIRETKPIIFLEANSIDATWEIMKSFPGHQEYESYLFISYAFNENNFLGSKKNIFHDFQETSLLLIPKGSDLQPCAVGHNILVKINNLDDLCAAMIGCNREPDHSISKLSRICPPLLDRNRYRFEILYPRNKLSIEHPSVFGGYEGALKLLSNSTNKSDETRIIDDPLTEMTFNHIEVLQQKNEELNKTASRLNMLLSNYLVRAAVACRLIRL